VSFGGRCNAKELVSAQLKPRGRAEMVRGACRWAEQLCTSVQAL